MKIIFIFIFTIFSSLYGDDVLDSFGTDVSSSSISNVDLKERVEGLISIVEGLSSRIHQLEIQKKESNVSISKEKLLTLINEIKKDYVSKDELNSLLLKSKSKSSLLKEAIQLFHNSNYVESKKIFKVLIDRKYKRASSNFYLGEIAYKNIEYNLAIGYFKKSIKLSDSTPFVKTLIFHSALSLEKIGKKLQAIDFYNNLIENYPDTNEAKQAKKRLRSLSK